MPIRGPPGVSVAMSLIVLQQQRTSYVLQDASVSEKCHIHVVLEKSHDTETLPRARLETKADKNIRCHMTTKILILIMTGLITAGPKQCNSIAIYPIDELVSLHE